MKLTLVLELVSTLLTTSMSVSCSSSMEQSEEELGSLSVNVDVLEWLCSGSPPAPGPPDIPMLLPPDPDKHPLPSRWLSDRIPPPPLSSELPAERAASPAAARWGRKFGLYDGLNKYKYKIMSPISICGELCHPFQLCTNLVLWNIYLHLLTYYLISFSANITSIFYICCFKQVKSSRRLSE